MSTREKILGEVLQNQPASLPLPDISRFRGENQEVVQKYKAVFESIGGTVHLVDDFAAIQAIIHAQFDTEKRIATTLPELTESFELIVPNVDPPYVRRYRTCHHPRAFCGSRKRSRVVIGRGHGPAHHTVHLPAPGRGSTRR